MRTFGGVAAARYQLFTRALPPLVLSYATSEASRGQSSNVAEGSNLVQSQR
jgi:ABC-type thiamine transport system substrate-binding protein